MSARVEQTPATNLNPVLSIENNGTVMYSNEAGEPILKEWGVRVGEKLPSNIVDLVQRVISRNNPEKIEVKVGEKIYLIVFHPSPEEECIKVSGFDISDQIKLEGELQESEDPEVPNLELSDIIDAHAIQSLMDDFYKLSHIPMALDDINGKTLVGVGWQDICTKFHRVHPDTCKQCFESNKILSSVISPGEIKQYKCMNNMWDIATPIIVDDKHVGNIFAGQFFYEDEPIDYELFRSRARRYGFDEEEYIEALEKVPRLSREAVNIGMSFLTNLGNMISQLSYGNIKLTQSLMKRDIMVEALRISEERLHRMSRAGHIGLYEWNTDRDMVYFSPEAYELYGCDPDSPVTYEKWLTRIHPDDRKMIEYNIAKAHDNARNMHDNSARYEFRVVHADGTILWLEAMSTYNLEGGNLIARGAVRDITERKRAEEALKKAHDTLEEKVKERTTELEIAYNSLKESEKSLSEAQKMAHIGNWEWDIATDKAYWSDELYRIFGYSPQDLAPTYNGFLNYIHPDDRHHVDNAANKALNEKSSLSIDFRIILADGEERTVHMLSEIIFDEKNCPVRIKGIVQDITERKKAEEKIQSLANVVESSNDAIFTISLDGIVTSCNKGAEQVYGYSPEEILGTSASTPAPVHLKGEIIHLIEKVKQGERIMNYETTRLRKDGKKIYVSLTLSPVYNIYNKLVATSVISRDITERIEAEKSLAKADNARKKEIHHRIKNNLQVISSLLDLQAEKFNDKKVIEAFRESQNRVISMALIHEELHKGKGFEMLNFSSYVKELADNLLLIYRLGNNNINLNTDLDQNVFFDMDTAVPLGIIINELVSNSLKYAFPDRNVGEIRIKLNREEGSNTAYILSVSDNGIGIPENLDIENFDSLGLQLVTTLVEQLDGELELKRDNGTEFIIRFSVAESNKTSVPSSLQLVDNE